MTVHNSSNKNNVLILYRVKVNDSETIFNIYIYYSKFNLKMYLL